MKKIALTICGVGFAALAIAQVFALNGEKNNGLDPGAAIFSWSSMSYDFGIIPLNKPVTHEFTFVNEGTAPLVISSVQASCGCTVTSYSREPVPAGGRGYVNTTFNAATVGKFQKTVTVNTNAEEGLVRLTISGEVID